MKNKVIPFQMSIMNQKFSKSYFVNLVEFKTSKSNMCTKSS